MPCCSVYVQHNTSRHQLKLISIYELEAKPYIGNHSRMKSPLTAGTEQHVTLDSVGDTRSFLLN